MGQLRSADAPVQGTIISESDYPNFGDPSGGHRAIVEAVDPSVATTGTGYIFTVEDNGADDSASRTLHMTNWVIDPLVKGSPIGPYHPYVEWTNPLITVTG